MRKTRILFFLLVALLPFVGFCGNDLPVLLGSFKSMKQLDHGVLINAGNARVEVLVFSPTLIRIRVGRTEFQPEFSYAVIQQASGNFKNTKETPDSLVLLTDSLQVVILKRPLKIKLQT